MEQHCVCSVQDMNSDTLLFTTCFTGRVEIWLSFAWTQSFVTMPEKYFHTLIFEIQRGGGFYSDIGRRIVAMDHQHSSFI